MQTLGESTLIRGQYARVNLSELPSARESHLKIRLRRLGKPALFPLAFCKQSKTYANNTSLRSSVLQHGVVWCPQEELQKSREPQKASLIV